MVPGALVDDEDVDAWRAMLGEADWRRTEQTWSDAGAPSADVALALVGEQLVIEVHVRAADQWFAPATLHNPLDNEHPDVNSAGLQLYLGQHEPADPAAPPALPPELPPEPPP